MVFTINALDNNYFSNGRPTGELENICFNSWTRLFDVKVFDFNSPEIKECKEVYKDYLSLCLQKKSITCYSDVLRMYILSLYPNSLYFDTDMYLTNPKELNFNSCGWKTNGCFSLIYNGYETDRAASILNIYKNSQKVLRDKGMMILAKLNYLRFYFENPVGVHFHFLPAESPHFNCICNDLDKIPELYKMFEKRPDKKAKARLYFLTDIFNEYKNSNFVLNNTQILCHRKNLAKLDKEDRLKILQLAKNHKNFIGE